MPTRNLRDYEKRIVYERAGNMVTKLVTAATQREENVLE
jgi:hypothetical protein